MCNAYLNYQTQVSTWEFKTMSSISLRKEILMKKKTNF